MSDAAPPPAEPAEGRPGRPGDGSIGWRLPASARLFSFSGRVERQTYLTLQVFSACLFVTAVALAFVSVRAVEPLPGAGGSNGPMRLELVGWAVGGAVGAMIASVLIGAGAVTRRARDGALPAIFIGLFYVINRLLLPVNLGQIGPPTVREVALHFAFIMLVVQVLLIARGTVGERSGAPAPVPPRDARDARPRPDALPDARPDARPDALA